MKTRLFWLSALLVLALALGACQPIQPMPEAAVPAAETAPEAAAPAGDPSALLDEFATNIPEGFLATGKIEDVKAAIDAGAFLIDVREADEYAQGHIPGAVNIPLRTLGQNLDKVPTDMPVLIYCASGLRAGTATAALRVLGYDNVKSFPGSMKAWTAANEEVSMEAVEAVAAVAPLAVDPAAAAMVDEFMSSIPEGFYSVGDVEKFQAAIDAGAFLLDVREENEFADGSIPGSLNIPIRSLMQNLDQIPQDQPVIAYCASGHRAAMANALLHMAGFDNVRIFSAGYGAWEAAQEPVGEMPAEVVAAVESDFDLAVLANDFLSNIPEGYYSTGPIEKTQEMIEASSPLLIDVREAGEYAEGHIPGAINIPLRTLTQNLDKIPADSPVVIYCASGHRAGMALAGLKVLGFDNAKSFPGGWKAWSAAGAEVSTEATEAAVVTPKEVNSEALAAVDEFLSNVPEGFLAVGDVAKVSEAIDAGAAVIDVREPDEFAQGHIAGAVNIPIRTLAANAAQVPGDQPVIIYCASGHRAAMGNAVLHMLGFGNVRSFPPGYGAWEAAGEPVEQ